MKFLLLGTAVAFASAGVWLSRSSALPEPVAVYQQGSLPAQTLLTPTPRARFTPTPPTRRGYYNLDVVGDFTLPATKRLIFSGAGRNLHVQQDWSKLFRRGFSSIDQGRMVRNEEIWSDGFPPKGWHSRLKQSQRAFVIYGDYFVQNFGLEWARESVHASNTTYRVLPSANARPSRNTVYQSAMELQGGCVGFGDCPPGGMKSTYGMMFIDIENDMGKVGDRQEQANLFTYLFRTIKENVSSQTEIGAIGPYPHYSMGYSRKEDYQATSEWLWTAKAQQTATSQQRGMPNDIVGKSFADYVDFQMPGNYYVYPDFDYTIDHSADNGRHWLASLLSEQEVNGKLSPKRRIAWQWLFNTQSPAFDRSNEAEHAAPPAIAEGMGVFYWFTGAYGAVLWDDHWDLTPNTRSPNDLARGGTGNDRHYACYEHYVHGLWRLFKHHGDVFNGRETYLNENTECSYDGGQTWYKYNANQLKTRNLPFVRAIVNGDQILVAATQPYAQPGKSGNVMLRYVQNGYQFYTTIPLKSDEIYVGRATMRPQ